MTARNAKGNGGFLPALLNVLGVLVLLVVVGLMAPLTVPRLLGYEVLAVTSGSMEPSIPVGSAVFVTAVEPAAIEEGDVIVFADADAGGATAHRVQVNRTSLGEFVTRGDANAQDDVLPVPYEALIGRVERHIPWWGSFMQVYASTVGKAYLIMAAAIGVMLNMLAGRMRRARRMERLRGAVGLQREEGLRQVADALSARATGDGAVPPRDPAASDGPQSPAPAPASAPAPAARRRHLRAALRVVAAIAAIVFLGSGGMVAYVSWQYAASDSLYAHASDAFTRAAAETPAPEPAAAEEAPEPAAPATPVAPISVDFAALRAENPDIIGWLYCEGTPIDYPVLQGSDNDAYLHTDYTGEYNFAGSIFADAANVPAFAGGNTIVYGHNMNSGSMFAVLDSWADQAFYDEHPIMWLLTPDGDFRVELFSGHHASARSSFYDVVNAPGAALQELIGQAREQSDFTSPVELDATARYVMFSTCAYLFDGDRYVLHGKLVPASGKEG